MVMRTPIDIHIDPRKFAAIFDDLSSNPLYLHHGDSLGSHIVVQPMNGDANPN
jgi:hypothetical protein